MSQDKLTWIFVTLSCYYMEKMPYLCSRLLTLETSQCIGNCRNIMRSKTKILNAVKTQLMADTTLPQAKIETIVEKVAEENPGTPWWVIVLKVIAYAIGIILAGYGTAAAATVYLPGIM